MDYDAAKKSRTEARKAVAETVARLERGERISLGDMIQLRDAHDYLPGSVSDAQLAAARKARA